MAFIEIEELIYQLNIKGQAPRQLYDRLSLSLECDGMSALLGPNGVGKTTLTKLILGFIKPDGGRVTVDGIVASDYTRPEIGQKIGYLFQNPSLQLFSATIEEELLFAYAIQDEVTDAVRDRCVDLIDRLSLKASLKTPVVHLSQGEKQRLAIGTLLMNDPDYLILDEPTSGLDGERKAVLADILTDLNRQGIGMLLITHDEAFIGDLPVTVYRMAEGQVTCLV